MAKNSNKKSKRIKARKTAERKESFLRRTNSVNPYDATLMKERRFRKDYYKYLMNAIEYPDMFEYQFRSQHPHDATELAQLITSNKLSSIDKKALKELIEVGRRSKIIQEDDSNLEEVD